MSAILDLHMFGVVDDFGGEITAANVAAQLKGNPQAKEVHLAIHSPGGSVASGLCIYDALRADGRRVVAHVVGLAGSISSVIMCAAHEVRCAENGQIFIHDPWAAVSGDAKELRKIADQIEKYGERIVSIYAERTKLPKARIRELMADSTYLSAEEALRLGFIDAIDKPLAIAACAPLSPDQLRAILTKESPMSDNVETLPDPKSVAAIQSAERARVSQIYDRCAAAKLPHAFANKLVASGASLDECNARIVDEFARVNTAATGPEIFNVVDHNSRSLDNPTFRHAAIEDAIVCKMSGKAPEGAAREFASLPIKAIAAAAAGRNNGWLDARADGTGFLTTSDWGSILSNSLNKRLLQMLEAAPIGIGEVAKPISLPDFRTSSLHQLSTFPSLKKVDETQEIEAGVFDSEYQSIRVETFARLVNVSMQALVNDDLNALDAHIRSIAMAVIDLRSNTLISALSAKLIDGNFVFHALHKNVLSAATQLDASAIANARLLLRKQSPVGSTQPMGLDGRTLLVSAEAEAAAWRLIGTLYPHQASEINPYSAMLRVIVEPRLPATSAYLFADSGAYPSLLFATLAQQPQPKFETNETWNQLGSSFRCYWSVGAGWADYRGAVQIPLTP